MQAAGDNIKVTSQAPQVTLVLYIFKLVLYFNSSITSKQIKYLLATKRRNFLQIHYGFYKYALQIHYRLWCLVIERVCTKNLRKLMSETWLLEASWWKFFKAFSLYEIVHVNLFFFDRRSCDKDWYLTSWTNTLTQIHIICNHYR